MCRPRYKGRHFKGKKIVVSFFMQDASSRFSFSLSFTRFNYTCWHRQVKAVQIKSINIDISCPDMSVVELLQEILKVWRYYMWKCFFADSSSWSNMTIHYPLSTMVSTDIRPRHFFEYLKDKHTSVYVQIVYNIPFDERSVILAMYISESDIFLWV